MPRTVLWKGWSRSCKTFSLLLLAHAGLSQDISPAGFYFHYRGIAREQAQCSGCELGTSPPLRQVVRGREGKMLPRWLVIEDPPTAEASVPSPLSSQIPASCAVAELLQASRGTRLRAQAPASKSHAAAFAKYKTTSQWFLATSIYTRVCLWDLVSLNSPHALSVKNLSFKDLSRFYRHLTRGAKCPSFVWCAICAAFTRSKPVLRQDKTELLVRGKSK